MKSARYWLKEAGSASSRLRRNTTTSTRLTSATGCDIDSNNLPVYGPTRSRPQALKSNLQQYYYPFSKIPRPKRNISHYIPVNQFARNFSQLRPSGFKLNGIKSAVPPIVRTASSKIPSFTQKVRRLHLGTVNGKNLFLKARRWRYKPIIVGNRFRFRRWRHTGTNQEIRQKRKRRLLKLWTFTAFSIILSGLFYRHRVSKDENGDEKPAAVRPVGPWKVYVYSVIPLKSMSRLWGKFNNVTLPLWLRDPGYRLYSYIFGVNIDEIEEEDLKTYKNLGEFFYRKLKPGARPIDENSILVSPADGKVFHFGVISGKEIEQVKGMTYSLEALLGSLDTAPTQSSIAKLAAPSCDVEFDEVKQGDSEYHQRHKEFAQLNGIGYTVDDLIGDQSLHHKANDISYKQEGDATIESGSSSSVNTVSNELITSEFTKTSDKALFFAVIYLAPGDYHRFHSPTNWVAKLRRHFVGELYSVAPYFQGHFKDLFVLNERVALLGRWKHGFFSMTPVGATNVGSIKINFDKDLTTNTKYEHPIYSRSNSLTDSDSIFSNSSISTSNSTASTTSLSKKKQVKNTCYEATYAKASRLLGGVPLIKGNEMGGFELGSTVVLVFEAPKNFRFNLTAGQKVKVGQSLGGLVD